MHTLFLVPVSPNVTSRYGYRKELLTLLQQLVRDMDRKIERQRERATKESENRIPTPQEQTQLDDLKVQWLADLQISHLYPRRAANLPIRFPLQWDHATMFLPQDTER